MTAACFARLWLMPLGSSFWTDEMGTVFVVENGAAHASLQVAPQVPQSVYYNVVRAIAPGHSEVAYRLPSVGFMALALVFVALLASRLIHPEAGWFAMFTCFALKGIDYEAANARPYAMGMCVAAAALFFLVRFLDTKSFRDALLFLLLAALLWRVHLIFWPFYGVFALYALVRERSWRLLALFAVLGALLIPVALRAVDLNAQASQHVVADQPSVMALLRSLRLPLVLGVGIGAWIWSRFAKRNVIAMPGVVLVLTWWLWHPLALYGFSHITGNSVFVPRYLSLALPGAALAATLAAAMFLPSRWWKYAALGMGLSALAFAGDWKKLWPDHHNSDWRGAARAINELHLKASTPVICPSPFIEARAPEWRPDYPLPGFLYAHLQVYPVQGNAVLFPFSRSAEAEQYANALLAGAIPTSRRFVIYGDNQNAHAWRDWFAPKLPGWTYRELGDFLDVSAVVFEQR